MNSPRDTKAGFIAVCSRGLVHSRTAERITEIQHVWGWRPLYTHNLPIPDAQNEITRECIELGAEWILFVEEDTVPPPLLLEFMDPAALVQCVDYPLSGGNRSISFDDDQNVFFCGMGCLLVATDVFKKLPLPWFSTNCFTTGKDGHRKILQPTQGFKDYGGQDIAFCYALQQAGIPIHWIRNLEAGHLRVKSFGDAHSNRGCHHIEFL